LFLLLCLSKKTKKIWWRSKTK